MFSQVFALVEFCVFSTNPAKICLVQGRTMVLTRPTWDVQAHRSSRGFRKAGIQDSACSLVFAIS